MMCIGNCVSKVWAKIPFCLSILCYILVYQSCSSKDTTADACSTQSSPLPVASNNATVSTGSRCGDKTIQELVRVSCIGDSITDLYHRRQSYTTSLQQYLGKAYNVSNFGVSSMTMLKDGQCEPNRSIPRHVWSKMFDSSKRPRGCSYWDTRAWQLALSSSPDIVLIMLGTNDAKYFNWKDSVYLSDYLEMINTLRSLPSAPRIFIMVPPPLYKAKFHISMAVVNQELPTLLRRVGSMASARVIDIRQAFLDSSEVSLTIDDCHPNAIGLKLIAQTAADAILQPRNGSSTYSTGTRYR